MAVGFYKLTKNPKAMIMTRIGKTRIARIKDMYTTNVTVPNSCN
jgi:hypothetical protein